jgi:hypothetical protein
MKVKEWFKMQKTELVQFACCFIGAICYKGLDVAGQQLNLAALSLGYVGFAVGISLIITLVVDNDPIPASASREQRTKIIRRVSKNAILMGFFWQTVLSKFQELVKI